jgi:putative PIN family toxin of toxin-antitoxin system
MRVVLDTNILARAAGSRGGPASELFERIAANHVLIVSLELLSELARALSYERVRRMNRLNEAGINAFIEGVEAGATVVPLPSPVPRVVPYDADDDVVVAAAIAGRAEAICTRNRHLFHEKVVAYCQQHAIEVMDDLELLARLRKRDE